MFRLRFPRLRHPTVQRAPVVAIIATGISLLAGCGSSPSSASNPDSMPSYSSKIDPTSFTDRITNPYFPLKRGTYIYNGTKDGAPLHIEVKVTAQRKSVMGVSMVEIHDSAFVNGKIDEDTRDWYAQDAQGSVWYFGEDTKELNPNGAVLNTKGTWLAGVDGAQPGIVMPAHPTAGAIYQQEHAKGVAEDMIKILRTDASATTPAGSYRDVVETEDTNPLEPNKLEHKSFAPGVGFVGSDMMRGGAERIRLTQFLPE
jgi:hypothetical protein